MNSTDDHGTSRFNLERAMVSGDVDRGKVGRRLYSADFIYLALIFFPFERNISLI